MKKIIYYMAIVLALSSCSTTKYFQIYTVGSDDVEKKDNSFNYENENCCIYYDFWAEGGDVTFIFENKTDSIIYIDLKNSFFEKNRLVFDYYQNKTSEYITSSYNNTHELFSQYSKLYVSDNILSLDNMSFAYGSPYKYYIQDKEIIAIPPKMAKLICEFKVSNRLLYFDECQRDLYPENVIIHSFTKEESPINFTNFITYKIGKYGKDISISNKFYITEIKNIIETSEKIKEEISDKCDIGSNPYYTSKVIVSYMTSEDNNRFYMTYEQE